jgi:hypothetical protein
MMIKKKMKDTTRKNVARSSVIMMILPLLSGETENSEHRIGTIDDTGGHNKDSNRHTEHDGIILPGVCHYAVAA